MDYQHMTVKALRAEANQRNIGTGGQRAVASKAALITALTSGTWPAGAPMNPEPNAFDAAFAAAGLMDRVNDGATGNMMTRVAAAGLMDRVNDGATGRTMTRVAVAGLMDRVNDGATGRTMRRVAAAACTIAELEAEAAIPEGEYDFLLDHVGLCLRDRNWPGSGIRIETAVREVLVGMKGLV